MSQLLETITLSGDFLKEFGIHVKEETVNAHCALLQISKEDTKSFPRFIAEVSRLEDRKTRYKMDKVTEVCFVNTVNSRREIGFPPK